MCPPIFEYQCLKCEHEYEVFYQTQSSVSEEEPSEKCPECGCTEKERKMPSQTSFQLKGKWFKQGY